MDSDYSTEQMMYCLKLASTIDEVVLENGSSAFLANDTLARDMVKLASDRLLQDGTFSAESIGGTLAAVFVFGYISAKCPDKLRLYVKILTSYPDGQFVGSGEGQGTSEPSSTEPPPLEAQDISRDAGGELNGLPKTLTLDLGRSSGLRGIFGSHVTLELVLIPAGKFVMGSPLDEEGRTELECPPLDVTISRPYYMGKYPVTQEQYEKIMGRNFSAFKGARNPADRVSWNNASEFCYKLSALTGKTVRLPTMAEQEYACRAGTTNRFYSGDSDSDLNSVGWYAENSGHTTHPVGQKAPNAWGLYDMHGNVYEWCQDVSGGDVFSSGPVTDPKGPTELGAYALGGGCWDSSANDCRSAGGMECDPEARNNITGFRVVVDPWRRDFIGATVSGERDFASEAREEAAREIFCKLLVSGRGLG